MMFLLSLYDRFVVEHLYWQRPEAFDYFATAIAVVGLAIYMCVDAFVYVAMKISEKEKEE